MSPIPAKADVVVIGGGPAGSTAANLLAQKGYDVVLLEKTTHPRVTVGESLLPHFWKYLDALGAADDIRDAAFVKKSGGTAVWRGMVRQMRLMDFGYSRPPLHVERGEFDHILLKVAERMGVKVFERVVARKIASNGSQRRVSYGNLETGEEAEITCRFIVDGSGQTGVIANQLGFREFDRDLRFMSVWGYFENGDYAAQGGLVCPMEKRYEIPPTTVQAGIGDWGWCWHIPQKESTSVGLVLALSQQAEFKARGANLEERFLEGCRRAPVVGELLRDATLVPDALYGIRDFAYHPTQLAGEGWYLVGDAAAFVDPINSAGVLTAFYTGSAAAACVDGSLKNESRIDYYTKVYSRLVRPRLTLFRLSALPEGQNTYQEDYQIALKAARLDSAVEQELLMVQTRLTDRSLNLAPLVAIDSGLAYNTHSNRYKENIQLTRLDSDEPFPAPVAGLQSVA
ncbi:MAG: tryptophan 7-halogenase [Gemmatimonadaceae bacterium]|nr:tryptophan 7-halogenase [Gemmatimonadaceae bacterium]